MKQYQTIAYQKAIWYNVMCTKYEDDITFKAFKDQIILVVLK